MKPKYEQVPLIKKKKNLKESVMSLGLILLESNHFLSLCAVFVRHKGQKCG